MYGHVVFFGLLTFPEKPKDGQSGAKFLRILHLALANKNAKEYTVPCVEDVMNSICEAVSARGDALHDRLGQKSFREIQVW